MYFVPSALNAAMILVCVTCLLLQTFLAKHLVTISIPGTHMTP